MALRPDRHGGRPQVRIDSPLALLPDALEDEDVLEMVNAGLLRVVVMDGWKAAT
ncbi:hypothetical protein [Cupriavidus sp. AU9028]|uniref:hypothetical protein n=1 Tax=Cupriavidus sp. AU9028 TaxID=2871157 RepID=UPI001C951EA8|nr:hypothetical protein [Cupriavidus sp. AU9028]MBY4897129.1 hypothetical protein [Cupriavidus sp. AU9028]